MLEVDRYVGPRARDVAMSRVRWCARRLGGLHMCVLDIGSAERLHASHRKPCHAAHMLQLAYGGNTGPLEKSAGRASARGPPMRTFDAARAAAA